jgi:hypothetical protein
MIIGISGKIGSGKDTIGEIIQGLSITNGGREFEVKKFAGKLKQIASLLTGFPVEKFEDQEFKKALLGEEWGTVRPNPLNAIPVFEDVHFNELMSVRELLQKLGTEAMRDGLHQNVWVNALFADYRRPKMSEPNPSNWIVTDVRFPNELAAINDVNGLTIRITSPFIRFSDGSYRAKSKMMGDFDNEHPSETALDDAEFDYEIINDGSIDDLISKVRQILITEKII